MMSFGSSQGVVRYAVLLQDQVTVPAQKISNEFRNMGTSMTTLTQKANVFNNSIMSNTRSFSAAVTPIKNTGNALNQLGVQQKTIGSQLASIGSGFKNNALAIGSAASSVLGLYQNYANLSSAQNAANKSATAAKAAQNNLTAAQDNLNKAIDKYGKGSKEATDAQSKLTVAQERSINKTESAKIAQDNLNQTMADFGINIIPNVVLAGGSFTDILSKMNGEKGIGGLRKGLSSLKGGVSSFASSIGIGTGALLGMSAALGGVALGLIELDKQMKLADWAHEFDAAGGASHRTLEQLRVDLAKSKEEASSWGNQLKTAFQAVDFSNIFKNPEDLKKQINFWPEVIKSIEQTINRKEAQQAFSNALAGIVNTPISPQAKANIKGQIDHINAILKNDFNFAARSGVTAQQSTDYTEGIVQGLIVNLNKSINSANVDASINKLKTDFAAKIESKMEGLTESLKAGFLKVNKGANFTGMTQLFAIDPKPISAGIDVIGNRYKTLQGTLNEFGIKVTATAGTFSKLGASANLAGDEVQKALADAAAESKRKLDEMASNFASGVDKMVQAFEKFHKGKGPKFEINFEKAKNELDKFISDFTSKLGKADLKGDEAAQKWVEEFAAKGTKGMSETSKKFFQPILAYAKAHAKDPPDIFVTGLVEVIGKSKQEVSDAVNKNWGSPMVKFMAKAGAAAGDKTTAAIKAGLDPKPIGQQISKMQSKIDSLHGKKVVIEITAHASGLAKTALKAGVHLAQGGVIKQMASGGLLSAQAGRLMTTRGPQLVLAGDNPGGKEDVAFIPHDNPNPTLATIGRMYGRGGRGSGGDVINVTLKIDGNDIIRTTEFKRQIKREMGTQRYTFGA